MPILNPIWLLHAGPRAPGTGQVKSACLFASRENQPYPEARWICYQILTELWFPTCNIVYWCMLRYFDIIDISFIFLQICLHENLSMRKRCSTHLYVFRYLYIYDRMTSIHIYRYTYRYTDTYTEPYIYIYTRTLYTYTFAFTYTFVYCVFSKLKPYQHCDHPQVPAGSVRPLGGFRTEAIHGADGFCCAWLIKLRWIP